MADDVDSDADLAALAERFVLSGGAISADDMPAELPPSKTAPSAQALGGDLFSGDPSVPLANVTHEQMLQHVIAGQHQWLAYQLAGNRRCSRETATQQASRVMARPEVKSRLRWLLLRKGVVGAEADAELSLDHDEAERILARAARTSPNVSDRVAALKTLQALREARGKGRRKDAPDPAFLVDYLRVAQEQGKDPVEQAKADEADAGADEPEETTV